MGVSSHAEYLVNVLGAGTGGREKHLGNWEGLNVKTMRRIKLRIQQVRTSYISLGSQTQFIIFSVAKVAAMRPTLAE